MENKNEQTVSMDNKDVRPDYEPPKIITYTSEQILEQIGPAMACSPSPCSIAPGG